ncbi:MAG: ribonuclease P protein component 1 [Promethearchaeota archaeon]
MPITPRNIVYHEIIGLPVKVRQKTGRKQKKKRREPLPRAFRTEGVVVDETKNTVLVETRANEVKKIIKKNAILRVSLPRGPVVEVDGNKLLGRPEDRLKNIRRKRWK